MKLTNQQEAAAITAHDQYWESYLKGDVKTLASLLDTHYTQIGSVENEVFFNKKDAIQFIVTTIDQVAGNVEMRNRVTKSEAVDGFILFSEQCDLYVLSEGVWTFYSKFRASSLMKEKEDGWKMIHQHSSLPDSKAQEGENIAIEKISAENLQLRDAVKRRTVELENKTRELEIEASLERVRAVALGMNKPEDMLDICRIISDQLKGFGIADIRNVQTAIIDENIGRYLCYQYFPAYDQTTIEDTLYHKSPVEQEMVKQMLGSRDGLFIGNLTGKELEAFRSHRKEENQFQDPLLDETSELSYCFLSIGEGGLGLSLYQAMDAQVLTLFKRFHQVFSLAYQRFRDIQKAETQAREAQIEAAVERVRAQSMAMHQTHDLNNVTQELLNQLNKLKVDGLTGTSIYLVDDNDIVTVWDISSPGSISDPGSYSFTYDAKKYPLIGGWVEIWRTSSQDYFVLDFPKETLVKAVGEMKEILPEMAVHFQNAMDSGKLTHQWSPVARLSKGILAVDLTAPATDDTKNIVTKMAGAFNQAYQRFLDLQKAEAQSLEAQIELALERVRARTMSMHKSEELKEVIQVVYDQFVGLHIKVEHAGFILDYKESDDMHIWLADHQQGVPSEITIPYFDSPHWNSYIEAKATGENFFAKLLDFEEKNRFYTDLIELMPPMPEETIQSIFSKPGLTISTILLDNVGLYIENYSGTPFSAEENAVLMRFGKVFQQTYTRFLDLQKAEEQAREAQIEAALERVRSRSMAMHKSEELREVVAVLYEQIEPLGMAKNGCELILCNEKTDQMEFWHANPIESVMPECYYASRSVHLFCEQQWKAWKEGTSGLIIELKGKTKRDFETVMFTKTDFKKIPEDIKKWIMAEDVTVLSHATMKYGFLEAVDVEPLSGDKLLILQRFAKVFEQAYTRFLDIQKAEAQAREAQIEAALERVRARTMAMQRSEELPEVAALLFQQVKTLGVPQFHCGFNIFEIDDKECIWYPGSADGDILPPCKIPLTEHPVFMAFNESRKRGDELFVYEKEGEYQAGHYRYMLSLPVLGEILQNMLDAGIPFPTFQIDHLANFSHGNLLFITSEHFPEMHETFKRFAKVFEQTYTRFLDLQKAEAQAREAKVEVALERIRARALAMQSSTELAEVAKVLRDQMGILGQEDLEASVVHLYSEGSPTFDSWYAFRAGDKILQGQATFRFENSALAKEFLKLYEDEVTEYTIEVRGQKLKEWLAEIKRNAPKIAAYWGDLPPEKQFYHFSDFSGGALLMVSHENLTEETQMLQKRCASVFELAYKRFLDLEAKERQERELLEEKLRLEQALSELKATQAQLIQSEKMASLGELTAGIAHEIQNPLNFVNNFSEVSAELVEEIQESRSKNQDKIDIELENEILEDIKQNLEKITLHGKRADAIVKGMLEHSKRGSGQKQETNINALADEFLRLTYQSFLAKDKDFRVELETNLDPDLPKISVIPQDIGKVLLNLYSNAFYACGNAEFKMKNEELIPKVTVSTSPLQGGTGVMISVKDNGPGIPESIKDKIFQPFFTTKPTGQGTGLGLSLSYDIVKAHGGELKVESEVGKGTIFTIEFLKQSPHIKL